MLMHMLYEIMNYFAFEIWYTYRVSTLYLAVNDKKSLIKFHAFQLEDLNWLFPEKCHEIWMPHTHTSTFVVLWGSDWKIILIAIRRWPIGTRHVSTACISSIATATLNWITVYWMSPAYVRNHKHDKPQSLLVSIHWINITDNGSVGMHLKGDEFRWFIVCLLI